MIEPVVSDRRVNYKFCNLNYPQQMRILVELNLLEDGDEKLPWTEFIPEMYRRAKEQEKWIDFWLAIQKEEN